MRKKLVSVLTLLCLSSGAFGLAACDKEEAKGHQHCYGADGKCSICAEVFIPTEGLSYELSNGSYYTVTGRGTSTATDIVIPSVYEGKPVSAIGDSAFYDCADLTSVVIPDSVHTVENYAFYGCSGVIEEEGGVSYVDKWAIDCDDTATSAKLRKNTKGIADYAFYMCGNLTKISLPDRVSAVGNYAFEGCNGIREQEGGVIYVDRWVVNSDNSAEKVVLREDTKGIADYAFTSCFAMTEITLPEGLVTIEEYAFYECINLQKVVIPASVQYFREGVFYECNGLTEVALPDCVTEIGAETFYNCTSLTSVTAPDHVTAIGASAFYNCTALTSFTLPNGVNFIGSDAFTGCNPAVYEVEGGVSYIGKWVASCDSEAESVTLRADTKGIVASAFQDRVSLTQAVLPEGLTFIGDSAFRNSGLTSIVLPDSVTFLGGSVFRGCSNMESVTLPKGLTAIPYGTFYNCTSMTTISLPAGVTEIGGSAFYNCKTMTAITLPEGVRKIEGSAFSYCRKLESIKIPEGVTSIGGSTFSSCNALASVTLPETLTYLGDWAFSSCYALAEITLPNALTGMGRGVFFACNSLTSVTVGENLTSIADYAFRNCTSLSAVYYVGVAESWQKVAIGGGNDVLTAEIVYYYSATEPTVEGKYWRYVDGKAAAWIVEE